MIPLTATLACLMLVQEPSTPSSGLLVHEPEAFGGFTILSPIASRSVYLLDMQGKVVHRWETEHTTGGSIYLLDDGHLLRLALGRPNPHFSGPGAAGGLLEELNWDGEVVWSHTVSDMRRLLHHDVEVLPNGNVLLIHWSRVERDAAIALGRDPEHVDESGMWLDSVLEIRRDADAEVVWEWRAEDHLVQDRDPELPGYGSPFEHPERIDINADHRDRPPLTLEQMRERDELLRQMQALGYSDGEEEGQADARPGHAPDWLHTNAVAYHPEYDLVVLSSPHLNELWILDHSTTTAEARGSQGGRWGRGGDLLWRWGNPRNYGAGGDGDCALFYQHDPTWVTGTRAGELRLLVFNNGSARPASEYSSLEELVLPFDPERGFLREAGKPFGPAKPDWIYSDPGGFFSPFLSGAQRLPNGNTLACSGVPGRVFEVTRDGRVVWDYRSAFEGEELAMPFPPPKRALFRATRVAANHPGLAAHGL